MPWQPVHAGSVEAVDGDGEESLLDVAIVIAGVGGRRGPGELLDHPGDVEGGDVGPEASVPVGAVDDRLVQAAPLAAEFPHLGSGFDGAGERGECAGAQGHAGADVAGERGGGVGLGERLVSGGDSLLHGQQAQVLEQFGLAAIAPVEAADAKAGAGGDRGDGGGRPLGGEHVAGGVEQALVIAGAFGVASPSAGAGGGLRRGPRRPPGVLGHAA